MAIDSPVPPPAPQPASTGSHPIRGDGPDWSKVTRRLDAITGVAIVLGLVYPRPYQIVLGVNAALPWVAIWVLWMAGEAIEFPQSRKDAPRPNVDFSLLMPCLILVLRLLLDYDLVPDRTAAGLAFGSVAGGFLLFYACLPKQPERTIWGFALALGVLYALPMLFLTDVWLDRSSPQAFLSRIEKKRITHSKHTAYNLRVSPWGPYPTPEEWTVGKALYEQAKEGDPIGILLYPGKWGIPWLRFRYPP
jgi:hypothetical protein